MTDELKQVHELYCQAYKVCQRAARQGKRYIGFRAAREGSFQLVASKDDCGGRSSARMGLPIPDWASNVLYRLRDECFIHGLPLDEYFDKLNEVGYAS